MASRGVQRTLAASRGHKRTDQPTIIYDIFYSRPDDDDRRPRKRARDDEQDSVLDAKRFRVTVEPPAGPTTAATTASAGLPTAVAPTNDSIITTAALAVVDQPINAASGPDEVLSGQQVDEATQPGACTCCCCRGCWCCAYEHPTTTYEPGYVSAGPYEVPYGANVAGATTAAVDEYSSSDCESSDEDEYSLDNVVYPAMLPIRSTGLANYADRWEVEGRATRPGVFVLHSAAYIDEESDSASSDSGLDDSDSDVDSDWTPPAVFPQPPDNTAHLQLGWTDVYKDYDYDGIARMTVAAGRLARTEPLPEDFVRSPPEPTWARERDNFVCPPWWDPEREAYLAAPLLGSPDGEPDDEQPIPYTPVRREIEEGGESVPWTNGCPWGQGGADDADGEDGGVAAEDYFYDSDSDDDYDDAYHEVVSHGLEVWVTN